ncbi:MAG TPA: SUMF1/EgtB/PvdO family nonheme iron enzyme [Polyangiaceae bacterium]|nr:SUMF1/EgtB/PvdO family nonheme iron enzyme [Polyangiaceae bacterium]
MPADKAELAASLQCDEFATWTTDPLLNETKPINCVSWYVAFAFCFWDGGRLPTEAEWEYAAAGGDENRREVWGTDAYYPELAPDEPLAVGSTPGTQARWGHHDLAGSVLEWVLDSQEYPESVGGENDSWYSEDGTPCDDCANIAEDREKGARGGAWSRAGIWLRPAARISASPAGGGSGFGVRCVR